MDKNKEKKKISSKLSSKRIPYKENLIEYLPSELYPELELNRWECNFKFELNMEKYLKLVNKYPEYSRQNLPDIIIEKDDIDILITSSVIENLDLLINHIFMDVSYTKTNIYNMPWDFLGSIIYNSGESKILFRHKGIGVKLPLCTQIINVLVDLENFQRKRRGKSLYEIPD